MICSKVYEDSGLRDSWSVKHYFDILDKHCSLDGMFIFIETGRRSRDPMVDL